MPSSGHVARGAAAERFAAHALERDGYRILLRNHRTPRGEIDLVAVRRGVVTFVEVKARRSGGSAGSALDALTPRKLRRVAGAAEHVLRTRGLTGSPWKLLGAAVTLDESGRPTNVEFVAVEEAP